MTELPTPVPISKVPGRIALAGTFLFLVGPAGLLWVAPTGQLSWWFLALAVAPSSVHFAFSHLETWREERRLERLGYSIRRWEFFSIGRSPAGRYAKMEEGTRRLRARGLLPHRDQVALAPAFAGMTDAEMVNLAVEMLLESQKRQREREAAAE